MVDANGRPGGGDDTREDEDTHYEAKCARMVREGAGFSSAILADGFGSVLGL